MSKRVCDEDCFSCHYSDCIVKDTEIEDKVEKRKAQLRRYYQKNRERILEYTRRYHQEHREERLAKARKKGQNPSFKARKREYYLQHREEIIKRNLENYYRKKAENERQKRENA